MTKTLKQEGMLISGPRTLAKLLFAENDAKSVSYVTSAQLKEKQADKAFLKWFLSQFSDKVDQDCFKPSESEAA
jgi:heat shock protein HspQ